MPGLRSNRRKRRRSTPLSYLQQTSASGIYWAKPEPSPSKKTAASPVNKKTPKSSPTKEIKKTKPKNSRKKPAKKPEIKTKPKRSRKKPSKKVEKPSKKIETKVAASKNSNEKADAKVIAESDRLEKTIHACTVIGDSGHFLEYRSAITAEDNDGYWASLQEQEQSWIAYQFEEPKKISEIGIRDRNDQMAPKTIKVEISENTENPEDGPWITILENGDLSPPILTQGDGTKWLKLDPLKVPVRFVKVHFLENFGSNMHYVVKQVLFRS